MANSNGWGDGAANNAIGWGQGANNAIAWGDSHAKSWAGATDIVGLTTDPAASAFITATGITGATQQAAIDNLVKGLKADGIWSKMKAVYPFVTDNRNLLGYSENFASGWANTGTTVTSNTTTAPNGTLTADTLADTDATYARLQQTIVAEASTYTMSIYIKKTSTTPTSYSGFEVVGKGSYLIFNSTTGAYTESGGTNYTTTVTSVDSSWWRLSIRTTAIAGSRVSSIFPAISTDGTTINPSATGSIIAWGAQLELGSTATTYQPIATTQQAFIASQFKYNLVNPVDSDAAFRLVFNGGWTHSSNGAQGNGTNGWADTKLQTNTNLSETSTTLSIYSRTNNTQLTHDIGARNFGYLNPLGILSNYNTVTYNVWGDYLSTTTGVNTSAYFIQTKNSTTAKLFRNTTNILTATKTLSALPTTNVIIGAAQDSSPGVYVAFSNRQYAFAHIGDGLTDTEAANLYTRVQAYQTALSRQV